MKSNQAGLSALAILGALALIQPADAQNRTGTPPPILDVHFHAMLEGRPDTEPLCPNPQQFLSAESSAEADGWFGWSDEDCSARLYGAPGSAYLEQLVAEMERLNVTAVVFGDPDSVRAFEAAAPGRVIRGTSFASGPDVDESAELRRLERLFTEGGFEVMGEIGLQYQGMSPRDLSVDQYFALAEQLDVPVAIHMGTGGSGQANVLMPNFRASMGDPLLLEDLLARHRGLRVQIMHAGYPMIDNLLALLQANNQVYVDVAGLIWSYPIQEVNRYIERIVDAGFGDRVMFGTDQLSWPGLMAYSISIIENADYLLPAQKRDILYNNAARFLRLEIPER